MSLALLTVETIVQIRGEKFKFVWIWKFISFICSLSEIFRYFVVSKFHPEEDVTHFSDIL